MTECNPSKSTQLSGFSRTSSKSGRLPDETKPGAAGHEPRSGHLHQRVTSEAAQRRARPPGRTPRSTLSNDSVTNMSPTSSSKHSPKSGECETLLVIQADPARAGHGCCFAVHRARRRPAQRLCNIELHRLSHGTYRVVTLCARRAVAHCVSSCARESNELVCDHISSWRVR
jgi:hypothetical protein